jgi:hypothetical protein
VCVCVVRVCVCGAVCVNHYLASMPALRDRAFFFAAFSSSYATQCNVRMRRVLCWCVRRWCGEWGRREGEVYQFPGEQRWYDLVHDRSRQPARLFVLVVDQIIREGLYFGQRRTHLRNTRTQTNGTTRHARHGTTRHARELVGLCCPPALAGEWRVPVSTCRA